MTLNSKYSALLSIFSLSGLFILSSACAPQGQNGSDEAATLEALKRAKTLDEAAVVSGAILEIDSKLKTHSIDTKSAATCETAKRSEWNSALVFDLRTNKVEASALAKIAASGYYSSLEAAKKTISEILSNSYLAMTLCIKDQSWIANLTAHDVQISGSTLTFSLKKHKDLQYSSTITGSLELEKFTAEGGGKSGNASMKYYAPKKLQINASPSKDFAELTFLNEQGKSAIEDNFRNYTGIEQVTNSSQFSTQNAGLNFGACSSFSSLNVSLLLNINADQSNSHPEITSVLSIEKETIQSKNLSKLKTRNSAESAYKYEYAITKPGTYQFMVKRNKPVDLSKPFESSDLSRFEWSVGGKPAESAPSQKKPMLANESIFEVKFEASKDCKIVLATGTTTQQRDSATLSISQ